MPRRNRRNPEFFQAPERPPARSDAPPWAELAGHEVRQLGTDKIYRCPGCDHEIRAGVWHLVVIPDGDPEGRRHWHIECWRRELHRIHGRAQP